MLKLGRIKDVDLRYKDILLLLFDILELVKGTPAGIHRGEVWLQSSVGLEYWHGFC